MIHISYPFYPIELIGLIRELKLKNNLRHEPLFRADAVVLILYLFMYFPVAFTNAPFELKSFLFIASTITTKFIVSIHCNRVIIPYSKGIISEAEIIGKPELKRVYPFIINKYLFVHYIFKGKVYKSGFRKKLDLSDMFISPDIIKVVYNSKKPKYNSPYFQSLIKYSDIRKKCLE